MLCLQLFINGDHVGDGEAVMELNETGEFDDLVKHYKVIWFAVISELVCYKMYHYPGGAPIG